MIVNKIDFICRVFFIIKNFKIIYVIVIINYFYKKKLKEFYDIFVGYFKLCKVYFLFISKYVESFNIFLKFFVIGFDGFFILL